MNYEEHPAAFVATEDLAYRHELTGKHARAIELAEQWVADHPDHATGRRLLDDLNRGN